MDFIFMLTRNDVTVPDCLEVYEAVRPLGLRHVGFKDLGVDCSVIACLVERIHDDGATAYFEMVGENREDSVAAAREAVGAGVDRLLGGFAVEPVLEALGDAPIAYYPFCGTPGGHPTVLGGTPEEIEAHCESLVALGCAGVDLLAYRAVDADPVALARAARRGVGEGALIVAGSIDSPARIRAMQQAGVDGVTVGSAVFEMMFAPEENTVGAQLKQILNAVD
jgi:hypothetical protein